MASLLNTVPSAHGPAPMLTHEEALQELVSAQSPSSNAEISGTLSPPAHHPSTAFLQLNPVTLAVLWSKARPSGDYRSLCRAGRSLSVTHWSSKGPLQCIYPSKMLTTRSKGCSFFCSRNKKRHTRKSRSCRLDIYNRSTLKSLGETLVRHNWQLPSAGTRCPLGSLAIRKSLGEP